jgi:hypothetical protein
MKSVRRDEVARRAKAEVYHTMKALLSSPDYGRTSLIQAYTLTPYSKSRIKVGDTKHLNGNMHSHAGAWERDHKTPP